MFYATTMPTRPFTQADLIATITRTLCLQPKGTRQALYQGVDRNRETAARTMAQAIAAQLSRVEMRLEVPDMVPVLTADRDTGGLFGAKS